MSETDIETTEQQTAPPLRRFLRRVARLLAPSLLPILAIVTAMLAGGVFMVIAGTDWGALGERTATEGISGLWAELLPGLATAGRAYLALLEGSTGIAFGGESFFRFVPRNLISTIVRSVPFLLAGLAVAVSFRCGLFNIGAEGQLYAGALLGVWIGFSPLFSGLPGFIHIPLALIAGIIGGVIWGAIPGFLKARTGAHEVINTIMMNYIAIRLADYLIKSRNPIILLDPKASTPRTPYILPSAEFPTIPGTTLHLGLLLALAAVVFVWWFLSKTTLGFEVRTVGTNPDAARYSGMSISRNFVLAMALSGALAGLAGIGEVLGVQHNLPPDFFAGVGFDSIAIALLAKNDPFAMIPAALLWGGLLNGAGLMQVRADLSIDLVKIIQAFIIMFIAADQIVRFLWRLRKARPEEEFVFLRGWGG